MSALHRQIRTYAQQHARPVRARRRDARSVPPRRSAGADRGLARADRAATSASGASSSSCTRPRTRARPGSAAGPDRGLASQRAGPARRRAGLRRRAGRRAGRGRARPGADPSRRHAGRAVGEPGRRRWRCSVPSGPRPVPTRGDPGASSATSGRETCTSPTGPRSFGWRAIGQRTDTINGRLAVTVYYDRRRQCRIAYTIVGAPSLALAARRQRDECSTAPQLRTLTQWAAVGRHLAARQATPACSRLPASPLSRAAEARGLATRPESAARY